MIIQLTYSFINKKNYNFQQIYRVQLVVCLPVTITNFVLLCMRHEPPKGKLKESRFWHGQVCG